MNPKLGAVILVFAANLAGCAAGGFLPGAKSAAGLRPAETARPVPAAGDTLLASAFAAALGDNLDERDIARAGQAQITALEQARGGVPIAWHNPDTGHSGQAISGPGYSINGRQCRDYVHTVSIGGAPQRLNGAACRKPDGTWQIVAPS